MENGNDKLTLIEGLCWEWTPDLLTLLPTSALDVYYAVHNMNAFPLYIRLILVGWFVDVGHKSKWNLRITSKTLTLFVRILMQAFYPPLVDIPDNTI